MKKESSVLIKNLIISFLIVICIILLLSIIFYDKISLSKVISQSEEYSMSEEMQKDIKEEELDESKQVITTYYVDAADLKKYESTKEYNKGKSNPFVEESDAITTTSNTTTENTTSSSTLNNSQNFYDDDGTK